MQNNVAFGYSKAKNSIFFTLPKLKMQQLANDVAIINKILNFFESDWPDISSCLCFYRLVLPNQYLTNNQSASSTSKKENLSLFQNGKTINNDLMMSQSSDHLLPKTSFDNNASMTLSSATSTDVRFSNDVTVTSNNIEYPPNVAISPGSCKSPYCCTSPGFCNFPYHNYETKRLVCSTVDISHNAISRTRSDPFPRDLIFVPDTAGQEAVESNLLVSRKLPVPIVSHFLPADSSMAQITTHDDYFSANFSPASLISSQLLSSTESSIFTDPLLVDITGNDVKGLLKPPKLEVPEKLCFNVTLDSVASATASTLTTSRTIRRSPPPPNVTLNPEKHKRNTLPQGKSSIRIKAFL